MIKNDPKKLVFIAGLGHSGSTLFNLLLGTQTNVIGLGEIDVFINKEKRDWYLKRYDKYPCTCGEKPSECLIWGVFKTYIDKNQDQPYGIIYRKLFNTVLKNTESNIVVDSSKNLKSLNIVYHSLPALGLQKDQFYVIHLVKDVRNFAASSVRRGINKNVLSVYKNWIVANRKIDHFLQSKNIKTFRIGYDELVLSPKYIMQKVCKFIFEGENNQVYIDLKKSESHVISGNNMRLDQMNSILYDYRWFNDSMINLFYSLLPGIKKLNQEWVYKNVDFFLKKKNCLQPPTKQS